MLWLRKRNQLWPKHLCWIMWYRILQQASQRKRNVKSIWHIFPYFMPYYISYWKVELKRFQLKRMVSSADRRRSVKVSGLSLGLAQVIPGALISMSQHTSSLAKDLPFQNGCVKWPLLFTVFMTGYPFFCTGLRSSISLLDCKRCQTSSACCFPPFNCFLENQEKTSTFI